MEVLFIGDPLSAERAHHYGLVNRLTAPGQALSVALSLAESIAGNAPLAIEAIKRIVQESSDWSSDQAWTEQRRISQRVFSSSDAKEGARAFTEKREPSWSRS